MEKKHVVPNHKQCAKNYRPVFLLLVCSKVLERIIYNTLFTYFIENNLTSKNRSGFNPGDSCVIQLAINHEIFSSFEDNYKFRGVFLAFQRLSIKVRHERIIHKLKCKGIIGNLLSLLTDFLKNRKQRVFINSQSLF